MPNSKIMLGTSKVIAISNSTTLQKKEKKVKKIDIDNFVSIKNWKAIGNSLLAMLD